MAKEMAENQKPPFQETSQEHAYFRD